MKKCWRCKAVKDLGQYWRAYKQPDKKDFICIECRIKAKEEKAKTPSGIYESKARLITAIMRKDWFPVLPDLVQIDHKFSISAGFANNVPLNIINNRNNLEPELKCLNLKKGVDCSITLEELYETAQDNEKLNRVCTMINKVNDPERLKHFLKLVWESAE